MKKNIFIILAFLFALQLNGFAQPKKVDSLMNALKKDDSLRAILNKVAYEKSDTIRVKLLTELSGELTNIGSYDKARQYAENVISISKNIGFRSGEGSGNYNMGLAHYYQRNNAEALAYFTEALKIKKELNDKKGISNGYQSLGLIQINKSNYAEAIENFETALKIKQEIDDKSGIATAYHSIGIANFYKGNYPIALQNYLTSLKIREDINDKRGIALSLNAIAVIYDKQHNYAEAWKNYETALKYNKELGDKRGIAACYNNMGIICEKSENDSGAIKNYTEALKIKEEIGDKKGITVTNYNMGTIYQNHEKYEEALKCFFNGLKICQQTGDNQGTNRNMNAIGSVYMRLGKFDDTRKYLEQGLAIARKIGAKESIKESYGQMMALDSFAGRWRDAYEDHRLYSIYKDSVQNAENTENIVKSQMQYEFDKKEAAAKAEQEKKDLQLQKEIALKALQFEYQKKQAAAKSEEERQQLKYEQQIKEQQIAYEYNQKINKAETEQKNQLARNNVLSAENNLMQQRTDYEKKMRWLMIAALVGFTAFGINYYRNYTIQKANNKKITKQAEDLKVLMREVHHRVKNNLQIIVAMLRMQARNINDTAAIEALVNSENRLEAIAIVHEKLYKSDTYNSVSLKDYLQELMDVLAKQHQHSASSFQYKITDNADLITNLDTAIPLGLIVNELVTNSFKYAFNDIAKGEINIELQKVNKSYELTIQDNGQGLKDGQLPKNPKSLGLRLVQLFTEQLNGTLKYATNNGARYTVSFA